MAYHANELARTAMPDEAIYAHAIERCADAKETLVAAIHAEFSPEIAAEILRKGNEFEERDYKVLLAQIRATPAAPGVTYSRD